MMFTSAARSDDAEVSSAACIAAADSVGGVGTTGAGGVIFFAATFGAEVIGVEVACVERVEVAATEFVATR